MSLWIIFYDEDYCEMIIRYPYRKRSYIPDERIFKINNDNIYYAAKVYQDIEINTEYDRICRDNSGMKFFMKEITLNEYRQIEKRKALVIAKYLFKDMDERKTPNYIYADMLEEKGYEREATALRWKNRIPYKPRSDK